MKFETFRGAGGLYYFRLKSRNGKIVVPSEGYKRKAGRDNAIAVLKACANAPVVEGKA